MSLHVSMSFPTQINNLPGYTSWDDDTSTLLNIAVSGVTPPEYELDTFCGAEVVVGSNGIPCESSPSASGIRRSSRTLLDSQDLRLAKPAPSMHGAYLKNVSHK